MAVASLAVRVSAQIAEFQSAFAQTSKSLDKFHKDFQGTATKAVAIGTVLGNVFTKLASSIASGIGSAISDAIRLSSEFNNAFLGLGSVAAAFGQDVGQVTDAAKRLSSDGLLPVKDAATGLKNLLSAGFNLEESTNLMNAFKDSAAFGRQGALSFGDAVRSATEGVKNGNSILVDNAGITKNLSQILVEAGKSAQDLSKASSDASVRQALYNGILKEARAQLGDAQKLTLTYTGSVTKLTTSYEGLLRKLGDTITQNKTVSAAMTALSGVFEKFIAWLETHADDAFNAVSDAIILFVRILSGTIKAIGSVQSAFSTLDNAIAKSVRVLADSVEGIGKLLINIIALAAKVPGASAAIGIAANEIRSLVIVTSEAGRISKQMTERISENDDRVQRWGGALGTASGFLDSLVTSLEETRGQTVELGAAAKRSGEDVATVGKGAESSDKAIKSFAKSLATLTAQIEIAKAEGTPLAELIEEWGKQASDVVAKADRLGIAVKDSARAVAEGFNLKKATEELAEFTREVEKAHAETREDIRLRIIVEGQDAGQRAIETINAVKEARERAADIGVSPLARELAQIERNRKAEIAAVESVKDADSALRQEQIQLTNKYYDHLRNVALGTFDTLEERMRAQGFRTRAELNQTADDAVRDYNQMRESGLYTAEQIQEAFERMNEALRKAGRNVGVDWIKRFKELKDALGDTVLTMGQNVAGLIGEGIRTGDWSQLENNLKDVLSNAFGNAAAAAVNFLVPGLGTLLQPIFSALGDKLLGWLGLGTKGRDVVKEFAASMGGFDAVRDKLRELGAEGEKLWINLTQGVGKNNPAQAKAAIDAITQALDRADKGMKKFIDGAMIRIKAFTSAFKTAAGESADALRKLVESEMPELEMGIDEANARKALEGFINVLGGGRAEIQQEFNQLGLYAGVAFAETLRDKGLAAAITKRGRCSMS